MTRRATSGASRALAGTVLAAAIAGCTLPATVDGSGSSDDVGTAATTTADRGLVGAPNDTRGAQVERVVDGDTVVVRIDGERERVRLLRIDTPELARDDRPAECLADRAAAALRALLPAGTTVELATDVEARDRFGRLLAHVWDADGRWVNGRMLRDGYASVVTFPPNTAFDDEVLALQQAARDERLGLWADDVCAR